MMYQQYISYHHHHHHHIRYANHRGRYRPRCCTRSRTPVEIGVAATIITKTICLLSLFITVTTMLMMMMIIIIIISSEPTKPKGVIVFVVEAQSISTSSSSSKTITTTTTATRTIRSQNFWTTVPSSFPKLQPVLVQYPNQKQQQQQQQQPVGFRHASSSHSSSFSRRRTTTTIRPKSFTLSSSSSSSSSLFSSKERRRMILQKIRNDKIDCCFVVNDHYCRRSIGKFILPNNNSPYHHNSYQQQQMYHCNYHLYRFQQQQQQKVLVVQSEQQKQEQVVDELEQQEVIEETNINNNIKNGQVPQLPLQKQLIGILSNQVGGMGNNNLGTSDEESSSKTMNLSQIFVTMLTDTINTITDLFRSSKEEEAVDRTNDYTIDTTSTTSSIPLSIDEIKERLQKDYTVGNYLWTGNLDIALFTKDCIFQDPTIKFQGIDTYQTNVQNLQPILDRTIQNRTHDTESILHSIIYNESFNYIETHWTMYGTLSNLPWQPIINVTGYTKFWIQQQQQEQQSNSTLSPNNTNITNKIYFYDERWTIPSYQALYQLVQPGRDRRRI